MLCDTKKKLIYKISKLMSMFEVRNMTLSQRKFQNIKLMFKFVTMIQHNSSLRTIFNSKEQINNIS